MLFRRIRKITRGYAARFTGFRSFDATNPTFRFAPHGAIDMPLLCSSGPCQYTEDRRSR